MEAAAAELPSVEINGVPDATIFVGRMKAPCRASVVSLQVREAGTMVSMLDKMSEAHEWRVSNMDLLNKISRLDMDLTALHGSFVNVLAAEPTHPRARDALRRYGWSITLVARAVGGPFYETARRVGRFLRRQADRPDPLAAGDLEKIQDRAFRLRSALVQLPAGLDLVAEPQAQGEELVESDDEDGE
ncbi:hypothetical protein ACP70R_003587 [Stipagrostis hirtigluma subsp. patula]